MLCGQPMKSTHIPAALLLLPALGCSTTTRVPARSAPQLEARHPAAEVERPTDGAVAERIVVRNRGLGALEGAGFGLAAGLGLALARRLARGAGGDVRLDRAGDGSGASFVVRLPGRISGGG